MVYPTLLAAIGDVAHPQWRAESVGIYRLWRDLGYVLGALIAGVSADLLGLQGALWVMAVLTGISGLVAAGRMTETHPGAFHHTPVSFVDEWRDDEPSSTNGRPVAAGHFRRSR